MLVLKEFRLANNVKVAQVAFLAASAGSINSNGGCGMPSALTRRQRSLVLLLLLHPSTAMVAAPAVVVTAAA
ncbi:hypothetical protein U9M48_036115 [Paspalum notatum var. saurae]|uniref:Uncharacterized protein n=1 Tax=Paspalum notatum var. saurae TaxID=547442 RepID=A0AAQ3UGJ8_PASNO